MQRQDSACYCCWRDCCCCCCVHSVAAAAAVGLSCGSACAMLGPPLCCNPCCILCTGMASGCRASSCESSDGHCNKQANLTSRGPEKMFDTLLFSVARTAHTPFACSPLFPVSLTINHDKIFMFSSSYNKEIHRHNLSDFLYVMIFP
jgi:hypothetical protein